ncbi:MAG TPA: beta-galactosidase trimerization domain-containing protein [Planctomycetota bacterium]|nr:beta-galactosidase trimerization domain-containing protein [Planctomycetota bacterium]
MSLLRSRAVCLAVASSLAASALAAEKPIRLIAEAEDFKVTSGDWKVMPYPENYFAATFAICFLSRMACLSAPAQVPAGEEAIATQEVTIPYDGEFQVFARYEQPFNFSAEFTVEIEQGGKAVYRQAFGRLEDPKIWALNGHKRVPMERYSWGGTDNIVWQVKDAAKLAAGPATLRLIAGPQLESVGGTSPSRERAMAAERHVDVLCLTNDSDGLKAQEKTKYLELDGWLVQDGDLFVRFTNPRSGLGPCIPVVQPFPGGQHSPYYVHVRDWPTTQVLKSGLLVSETKYLLTGPRSTAVRPDELAPVLDPAAFKTIPDSEWLQPGERSGWVPMGQALDALNNSQWFPVAKYKDAKQKELDLELEFAIPTRRGRLDRIRTVRVKGVPAYCSPVTFEIPGNVTVNQTIRTEVEALEWLKREIRRFRSRGAVPKRFAIYGLMAFSGAMRQEGEIGRLATEIALALGHNTMTPLCSAWTERLGVPPQRAAIAAHWYPSKLDAFRKTVEEADKKGSLKQIKIVSYGDEIHIPPAAGNDDRFNAWLAQRRVDLGGRVSYATSKERENPFFYYATLFDLETGMQQYADATRWLEERAGKDILTGANYSPHANYLVTDLQWVRPFKMRAMTMPWSEDYVAQIPEFSFQVVGYLTSAFRCGAKYRRLPIMIYVMPHWPNSIPRDFRLSFYTCVAHGATKVNYFCASPLATGATENYISTEGLDMWRAVHDTTHDAGTFEDYVLDGTVRPARVGLLLSSVDELLTGDSNFKGAIHNAERKAIYFALRHAQVPVDFLTEDDVIGGLAKDYKVIYLTQQYVHSKALKALTAWAEAGGTVVALCGGGFTNEFKGPNPDAEALYGVKSGGIQKDEKLTQILAKQDLAPSVPVAVAKWGEGEKAVSAEAIAWRQALEPKDGKVLGTFADGKPAVIEKRHGKGRAVLFAFLPGLAYLKSGLPLMPPDRGATERASAHFLPTGMDAKLRRALVDDFLPADFARPVECSETLVETTVIDTEKPSPRLAVPLMNYTGKPIRALTVKVRGVPSAASVRSVEQTRLRPKFEGDVMTLTLPLDVADMLLIDR